MLECHGHGRRHPGMGMQETSTAEAAFGGSRNFVRLLQVKAKFDPMNFFKGCLNIRAPHREVLPALGGERWADDGVVRDLRGLDSVMRGQQVPTHSQRHSGLGGGRVYAGTASLHFDHTLDTL